MLAAAWGSAFVAIEAGLAYFPPVLFAALRYGVAGVVMLAYAAHVAECWRPRTAGGWQLVAFGGLFLIAGHHACLFVGQQYTTSAVAAVVWWVVLGEVVEGPDGRRLRPDPGGLRADQAGGTRPGVRAAAPEAGTVSGSGSSGLGSRGRVAPTLHGGSSGG